MFLLRSLWASGLLLVAFLLGTQSALAVTVDGLYRAQVPVSGTSEAARTAAFQQGLRQVAVRVSGRDAVLDRSGIASVIESRASDLVQSYQYKTLGDNERYLTMQFGAVGVNRALAEQGVAIWGANRPLTFAWIAVDSGRDRQLVTGRRGSGDRWHRAFTRAANLRGIPLRLPSDQWRNDGSLLSDIRGRFTDKLRERASAIPHNLLAIMNVSRFGNGWRARWELANGEQISMDQVRGSSPEQLARRVLGLWAESLADRYAVSSDSVTAGQEIIVKLDQVDSLEDYGAIRKAFMKMAPVDVARPVRMSNGEVVFHVAFSGEISVLKEYIALEPRFIPLGMSRPEPEPEPGPAEQPSRQPASGQGVLLPDDNSQDDSATEGSDGVSSLLQYEPLEVTEPAGEESDSGREEFEAVYPVLRYRWQPVGGAEDSGG